MEENYEIVYSESIYEDFSEANLNETKILKIKDRMLIIGLAPFRRTDQLENMNMPNLRKARFGDYRMFMDVDEGLLTITCLAFLHRHKCYSSQNKKRVVAL